MPDPGFFGDTETFPQIYLFYLKICGLASLPSLAEDGSNMDFLTAPGSIRLSFIQRGLNYSVLLERLE